MVKSGWVEIASLILVG